MRSNSRSHRRVIVDLDALKANYKTLDKNSGDAICAAVVKANAYGLGVCEVAPALFDAGCRWFFVASADEALELKELLPEAEVGVFEGPIDCDDLLRQNILPVLNSYDDARLWAEACGEASPGRCIVHIDSGMNRLGMTHSDVTRLVGDTSTLSRLAIEFVATHLANAEQPDDDRNRAQLERFDALRAGLPVHKTSIANSSGVFLADDFCRDMVRAGIAIYGGNPTPGIANPMQSGATVQGRVVQIRNVEEDDAVGYGATADINAGARLATVGFGYADGYLRSLSNVADAMVAGKRVPVIGRVSMDSLVVDITGVGNDIDVGDWVTLVGAGLELDEVAKLAGTISYELLTSLGARVERVYARQ